MKIGIYLDSLGLPLRAALTTAARASINGVRFDSLGDLMPDRLTQTGRREIRNLLRSYNLELAILGCPLRHGLEEENNQQPRIEHVRKVMTLAGELGTRLVFVPMAKLPPEADSPESGRLREALTDLSQHGDRVGVKLALHLTLDTAESVLAWLGQFDTASLGVDYDPGTLLLNGLDPMAGIIPLCSHIVHTHARDARKARLSRAAAEVALGAGDIDWLAYLVTLQAAEYRGYLTIARESGDSQTADVIAGVDFLKRLMPGPG